MFKIAAILTSAAIACSGAACTGQERAASRIAAARCGAPTAIVTQCPEASRPSGCGDWDCISGNSGCGSLGQDNCFDNGWCIDPDAPAVDPEQPDVDLPPVVDPEQPDVDLPPVVDPEQPGQTPGGDVTDQDPSIGAYAQEVIRLVNIEREKAGLPALKTDALLNQAAQQRAVEIADSFAHTRPDGSNCFTVLKEFGISYRACGENIAKGQITPERVVTGWMNSEGHRKNILNGNFTTIGVGYYVDNTGTAHWSQLFTA